MDQQGRREQVIASSRGPDESGGHECEQTTGQDALVQPQLVMANGTTVFNGGRRDHPLGDHIQLAQVRLGHGRYSAEQLAGRVQGDAAGQYWLQPARRPKQTSSHGMEDLKVDTRRLLKG